MLTWLFRAILYGALAFLLAHSIVACGGGGDDDETEAQPRTQQCDRPDRECVR